MNSPVQTFNTGGVEVNPYPKLSVNVNSPIENNTVGSEIKNICPPPPPTGSRPNDSMLSDFQQLSLNTDDCDEVKYSESVTPNAPKTDISVDCDKDTISESSLIDSNGSTEEMMCKSCILRDYGNVGYDINPEKKDMITSPIKFEGVEYISSSPKTDSCDKETNTEQDFRIDVVMRNMDMTKEEAHEFVNDDENEENLCPLIHRNGDSYNNLFPDDSSEETETCEKSTSPLEAREKVIEEYEDKLNDLTLEIFEKQTRLEEIELSLARRERRIKIKENNLSLTVFDNVFHLSIVILVGYATTRIFSGLF